MIFKVMGERKEQFVLVNQVKKTKRIDLSRQAGLQLFDIGQTKVRKNSRLEVKIRMGK